MKKILDLSECKWALSGWMPNWWMSSKGMETGIISCPEIPAVPVDVPGSVQGALLRAGVISDWNIGSNARASEWVENRHWLFEATLPALGDLEGSKVTLRCLGLDYSGWILLNGEICGEFTGSFVPHTFDLSDRITDGPNRLTIVFANPPRWLGQSGFTSQIREWKPRYNYTWDWTVRVVQLGIWDKISLEISKGAELGDLRVSAGVDLDARKGTLKVQAAVPEDGKTRARITLSSKGATVRSLDTTTSELCRGITLEALDVEFWQPNGNGSPSLYTVRVELIDAAGSVVDCANRSVGFKHIEWRSNPGAPVGAHPWVCVINGRETFLQGVNWTPISPTFADCTPEQYRRLLELYRQMGCNLLRVWGGAFLEKEIFYDLCDDLGLLVWQELPLSSSGLDNWPPEDERSIADMVEIATSYIERRSGHACLLMWCGGNELQGAIDGNKAGIGKPIDMAHPMMARLNDLFASLDPDHRFVETSASGPRFNASEDEYGKGLHWDVHGPWSMSGSLEDWKRYWAKDDSLFRSETGSPGASPADIIRAYAGDNDVMPGTLSNSLWRRTSWWIEWDGFISDVGREPESLEEYVSWSQERQASALSEAARSSKARFPECGGILIWMGHDSFPCTSNTSIIDFWGRPKPAALALAEVFIGDLCRSNGAK